VPSPFSLFGEMKWEEGGKAGAGWRAPAALRARRDCRDGLLDVRAAELQLASISGVASHNCGAAACAVGRQRGAGVVALFRPEAAAEDGGGQRRAEAAPGLKQLGKLVSVPGDPTAVAWSDGTLACGTRECTVELFRMDPTRDDTARSRKVAASLQPQWGATASSQQAAAGTISVAVGALEGRHAGRVGAVVGASPCLWDVQGKDVVFGTGPETGAASCMDLDWDKGVLALGDTTDVDHHLTVHDPRQPGGAVARAGAAHFAPLTVVRFSVLHPHWLASGAADGLVKVWDLRRLQTPLFRLGWHVSSVSDLGWSWAHSDILVSSALDGTLRFWNLSLPPHFQLANADAGSGHRVTFLFVQGRGACNR